jgi:hypothetical protein
MSKAIELFKQDGSPSGVFYCSECRAVFGTKDAAILCHGERVCSCGGKITGRYQAKCDSCQGKEWKAEEAVREQDRFEKAQKIAESDYYGDMVSDGDKFYDSVEEAIDGYLVGQEPEYVWACKNIGVPLATTESLYENLLENMWEEADVNDLNGVDELEDAVTAFNEANKSIHVYHPDYSKAILISKRKNEEETE